MTQKVTCNECGEAFVVGRQDIETIKDGEIEVQYFRCPDCRRPYLVITTDKAMRQLIEKRHILTQTIRLAYAKKFRPQVVQGYMDELDVLKSDQKKMLNDLNQIGYKLLERVNCNDDAGSTDDSGSENKPGCVE